MLFLVKIFLYTIKIEKKGLLKHAQFKKTINYFLVMLFNGVCDIFTKRSVESTLLVLNIRQCKFFSI